MADMTPRERVQRALRFEKPDRAPRELWILPGAQTRWAVDIAAYYERFPSDFTGPAVQYGEAKRASGAGYHVGRYTDAWGSIWEVAQEGVVGEVAVVDSVVVHFPGGETVTYEGPMDADQRLWLYEDGTVVEGWAP